MSTDDRGMSRATVDHSAGGHSAASRPGRRRQRLVAPRDDQRRPIKPVVSGVEPPDIVGAQRRQGLGLT